MPLRQAIAVGRTASCAAVCAWLTLVLAGCTGQMEPAQEVISDIDTSIAAASPDAAIYIPQQLIEEQGELAALKAAFDRRDYAAVLRDGPSVLRAAQGLAAAAEAKKAERLRVQNAQWASLAGVLPDNVTAIQNRIDVLAGKKAAKKPAKVIDLDAARASLSDDSSLWSKAQAAFATGNMDEALNTAKTLETRLDALAGVLQMKLSAPPAVPSAL